MQKPDEGKAEKADKENTKLPTNKVLSLYDEDKDITSIGNRKIQCGHVKSL